jgi:predicted phage terminase large subunit-like protein
MVVPLYRPRLTEYIPHRPTPKQQAFLLLQDTEVLFGGAAGGGKSDALLMAALQYADIPGYAALLLRRTYGDLKLPGALLDRAAEWLMPTRARWVASEMSWIFPGGGSITFGHLSRENDKYRYQSAEFQFVGFDELTQFTESQYTFLFSRLRRTTAMQAVPLRMRAASNPGGIGHAWVKSRFIPDPETGELPVDAETGAVRRYIPARLEDNPYLEHTTYLASLSKLDPVTRAQYRAGDWEAHRVGGFFDRDKLPIRDRVPKDMGGRPLRYWDLASTPESADASDPDWTVGVKMQKDADGGLGILDVQRERMAPGDVKRLVKQTAARDGRQVTIVIEQEPGSSGKFVITDFRRALRGYSVRPSRTTGSKEVRAGPLATAADNGDIWLLRAGWNMEFISEAESFPAEGVHDDQVDAASGAFEHLVLPPRGVGF